MCQPRLRAPAQLPRCVETQILLRLLEMAKLGEQCPGQGNLLGKTKVMTAKPLKARGLAYAGEKTMGLCVIGPVSFFENAVVFLRLRQNLIPSRGISQQGTPWSISLDSI